MPWKETTAMSQREDFITQFLHKEKSISSLCREFGISRTTGYKWMRRYERFGITGLVDQSRRPRHSPNQTPEGIEAAILSVRAENPSWGGVKILAYLDRQKMKQLPAASTATVILQRNGKMDPKESCKHQPMQRFEREQPNELWQMDFKGDFGTDQGRCHPLTVLDDHSRFLLGLHACANERWETVQERLIQTFRTYGLPECMLMDNGAPWGDELESPNTILTAWLMRLGISITHGRPYHPQTQGKEERLHRTFKAEVLQGNHFRTLPECQCGFDVWRDFYNHERPHQSLNQGVPAEFYRPSPRPYPETLPPIFYDPVDIVRLVDGYGKISYKNKGFHIGRAFRHFPVALRPTEIDGILDVYYCSFRVKQINLRKQES